MTVGVQTAVGACRTRFGPGPALLAESAASRVAPPTGCRWPCRSLSFRRGPLAVAAGLPRPNDGGRGIGYAVIDASRTVRYATLDPSWLDNTFEVDTVANAVSSQ